MSSLSLRIPADHPAFNGHFPGNPLLPGVALLAEVIEAVRDDAELATIVGPRPKIGIAKFLAPVLPGAELVLELQMVNGKVKFEFRQGKTVAASGNFERPIGADAA